MGLIDLSADVDDLITVKNRICPIISIKTSRNLILVEKFHRFECLRI
jgi:hypothetical protein